MRGRGLDKAREEEYVPRTVSVRSLDGGGKWGAVHRGHLLLWRAAEEEAAPQVLEGKRKIHGMAHGHEGDGDEDEQTEGLGVRGQNHHDEVQQIQEVVHGVLDTIDHTSLRLDHILLDKLGHGQVEGPQTWR